jgi:hypothetical protein
VAPDATLADVMGALLTSDAPAVRVIENASTLGVVTLESIRSALRNDDSHAEVETEGPTGLTEAGSQDSVP